MARAVAAHLVRDRILSANSDRSRLLPAIALAFALLGARTASAQGVAFDAVNAPWNDVLVKARPLDAARLVLVEIFTDHCGLCRALERETFEASDVAAALRGDLCVRYDAEGEAGRPVAERFRVRNFPTTLFLDPTGDEVDRVIGFISPTRFVEETARIRKGDATLKALRAASAAAPTDARLAVAYGRKLARAGDADGARLLLEPVADAVTPDPTARPAALLGLAELSHRANDARAARERIERLIESYPNSVEASDGRLLRVELEVRDGAIERALEAAVEARRVVRSPGKLAYLEETVAMLERKKLEATILRWGEKADAAGDVESLHRAARAALDRRLNVGSALRWAEAAAKAVPDDPVFLETHAGLLFETGSPERALSVGARALDLARDAEDRARIARHIAAWRASADPRPSTSAIGDGSDAIPRPPLDPPAPKGAPVPVHPREGESEHPTCPLPTTPLPTTPLPTTPLPPCPLPPCPPTPCPIPPARPDSEAKPPCR